MSSFADSSALVKLYADEADHEPIRSLGPLVVSALARVEVPAALWRKHRMGELDLDDTGVLLAAFEADYFGTEGESPRFAAVAVGAAILDDAARLAGVYGLRAYDAIQLATAVAVRTADPGCGRTAVFDAALRRAAAMERFALVPAGRA